MEVMAERRFARRGWILVALVTALVSAPSSAATPPPPGWASWGLVPGVDHLLTERPGLVAHVARVEPGAPVVLRPVVAFDRVGGGHAANDGRQPVSELCSRVGGIVCVNGDFFNCGSCGQAAGGLVERGRALRSFRGDHEQVSIIAGLPTLGALRWVGRLRGVVGPDPFELSLASLNRGPMPGGAVIYTPDWGPTTPQVGGQVELVFAAGGPHRAGLVPIVPVEIRPTSGVIPRDGVVIAANGAAAERLNWLWHMWHTRSGPRRLELDTALSAPADLSVGGHPVLLRGGVRQPLDNADPMVVRRHPRTVLGWTAKGALLLVTIDGRQPGYSEGATLYEAMDLLSELGATNAINLDGGGSTTFALRCGGSACVANRPSGRSERPVPVALALVPAAGATSARGASVAVPVSLPPSLPATTLAAPPATVEPPPTTTTSTTVVVDRSLAQTGDVRTQLRAAPAMSPASLPAPTGRPVVPIVTAALTIVGWMVLAKKSLTRKRF